MTRDTVKTFVYDPDLRRMVEKSSPAVASEERKRAKLGQRIREAFDPVALKRICEMEEDEFRDIAQEWIAKKVSPPYNRYFYLDRGAKSRVLAIAHLDTVQSDRSCTVVDTPAGPIALSGALDDRLGAWVILDLLPKLGVKCDVLLTTGEECGQSTARLFASHPKMKQYNWIFSFDRKGTDVVLYRYEDHATAKLVREVGARVGSGSFSDVCCLYNLGVKGFNWGVGYEDYHTLRGHAWLHDTFDMVAKFVRFFGKHHATKLEHTPSVIASRNGSMASWTPDTKWDTKTKSWVPRGEPRTPESKLGDAIRDAAKAAQDDADYWAWGGREGNSLMDACTIADGYCPTCFSGLDAMDYCSECRQSWALDRPANEAGMAIDDETGQIIALPFEADTPPLPSVKNCKSCGQDMVEEIHNGCPTYRCACGLWTAEVS